MNVPVSPNIILLVLFSVRPLPSVWVRVVSLSTPKDITELSVMSLTSSPKTAFNVTLKPPSVCNEPSATVVALVVSSVLMIPDAVIVEKVEGGRTPTFSQFDNAIIYPSGPCPNATCGGTS